MSLPPAAGSGHAGEVVVLEHETLYQGYFRLDRYRLQHSLYDGGCSGAMVREIFERGHAVAVVPYDPVADVVVLIEQFRPGAYVALQEPRFHNAFSPWLIEVVAGIIDPGETAEEVARREGLEEAGIEITDLEPLQPILATPGVSSEVVLLYVGRITAAPTEAVYGVDSEHENIRVLAWPSAEVFRCMDEGRIVNGPSLCALQWFRIHHQRIRARWLSAVT